MTAVTDHAGSKQADAITVPDFRQKLLASMQQSGVVDSLAVRELDQSGRAICSLAFLQRLHCLPPLPPGSTTLQVCHAASPSWCWAEQGTRC